MASSVSLNPPAYACITVLAGHFAAVHIDGRTKRFISKHPTKDYGAAWAAAKAFADLKKIPFQKELKLMDRPLITVFKTNKGWLPGRISTNDIAPFLPSPSLPFSGLKENAMEAARMIAEGMGADFVPSIGLSMAESKKP